MPASPHGCRPSELAFPACRFCLLCWGVHTARRYNNEELLRSWAPSLLGTIDALTSAALGAAPSDLFVAIYESGSTDATAAMYTLDTRADKSSYPNTEKDRRQRTMGGGGHG